MKDINNGLQIGSSLSYQSENFLDRRQGQATSLSDLLNWSIKVPKGYEVCVNGLWYFYDPSYTSTETGHFFPRVLTKLTSFSRSLGSEYLCLRASSITAFSRFVRAVWSMPGSFFSTLIV